jgi:dTDP-4-dehydrorhamnose reductase
LWFNDKKVLIVGATGKIAEAVIRVFRNDSRFNLKLLSGSIEDGYSRINGLLYHKINYTHLYNLMDMCSDFKPDIIINLAAMTDVDGCEVDKKLAWDLNVSLPSELAKISSQLGCKFIHISTDYIFDGNDGPYSEHEICNPISYYGFTKLTGETESLRWHRNTAIIRTNVVYGYSELGKGDFVSWVIDKIKNGTPLKIVNDQYSNPTLTDDIALSILKIIEKDVFGILNVGGSQYCDRYEFANTICDVFELDSSLLSPTITSTLNQKAKRPLRGGLDIRKLNGLGLNTRNVLDGLTLLKGYMDGTYIHTNS